MCVQFTTCGEDARGAEGYRAGGKAEVMLCRTFGARICAGFIPASRPGLFPGGPSGLFIARGLFHRLWSPCGMRMIPGAGNQYGNEVAADETRGAKRRQRAAPAVRPGSRRPQNRAPKVRHKNIMSYREATSTNPFATNMTARWLPTNPKARSAGRE
jgi:hypothetical protein